MSAAVRVITGLAGAAAFSLMGVLVGAWWAPVIGGLAAGIFIPRARWAVLAGAIAGLIAWGVPLEYAQLQYGLAATSLSLAAVMGFDGAATVPVALTLLTGTLLGLSGAWFGSVARGFYESSLRRSRKPPVQAAAGSKAGSTVAAAGSRGLSSERRD